MLNGKAAPPCPDGVQPLAPGMFVVDEKTAEAIRCAWDESGELPAVVELRRHYPLITDNAQARLCVRTIVGWVQRPASDKSRE